MESAPSSNGSAAATEAAPEASIDMIPVSVKSSVAAPTPGSTDLASMLRSLEPVLDPEIYVFCTFARRGPAASAPSTLDPSHSSTSPSSTELTQQLRPPDLPIKLLYEEAEGTTVVTTREAAVQYRVERFFFPCRCVTLSVHSSLDAVGLLAAVTTHLAREVGIGVNPVSAFFHDHLYVPLGKEDEVVVSLKQLAAQAADQ